MCACAAHWSLRVWWFLFLFCEINLLRIIFCLLYAVVLSCRTSVSGVCEDLQATNPEIQMAEDVKLRSLFSLQAGGGSAHQYDISPAWTMEPTRLFVGLYPRLRTVVECSSYDTTDVYLECTSRALYTCGTESRPIAFQCKLFKQSDIITKQQDGYRNASQHHHHHNDTNHPKPTLLKQTHS